MSLHHLTKGMVGLAALALTAAPGPARADEGDGKSTVAERSRAVRRCLDAELPGLVALYKHLHAHPELSLHEVQTSARLAKELRGLGFTVTEKVGGNGVVGVFNNGKGPTLLIRTDMDALPVVERTGLPYASKVRTRDRQGNEVGVM